VTKPSRADIAAGLSPRKDYFELQDALGADILDLTAIEKRSWSRFLARACGTSVAQAVLASKAADQYDAVFADRESTGFALATLLKLRRKRPRLTVLTHFLSSPAKQRLFRSLWLDRMIDAVLVHSSSQEQVARDKLDCPAEKIKLLPYHADTQFWRPERLHMKNQVCSVGLEYRDYPTVIEAMRGLDLNLVIAAASHWSKHRAEFDHPANVRVSSFNYPALRTLYAESLFVVVPLVDIDNQAGITVILEAMAAGKAIVVSHTRGQTDVVRDRRRQNRTDPSRPSQPDWLHTLGVDESVATSQTGIYVMPGDADELRRALDFLVAHPEMAAEMGANGRRVVEAAMSLDLFTRRVADIITGQPGGARTTDTRFSSMHVSGT
jgi:glycosyltransferase involved in cell wall biosynthesis